ncbi:MAG: ice-binding family protein [Cucumibacter sp.]
MTRITKPSLARCGRLLSTTLAAVTVFALALTAATSVSAQSLETFAVLAGETITNTNTTTITGNIGLSPGSDITGVGPGADNIVLTGAIYIANGVALQAKSDLTAAYVDLMGRPFTTDLSGDDLGTYNLANPLTEGVYSFSSSAQLTGTLAFFGDADDIFIIQVGSDLTTAPNSVVLMDGGALASNVFFVLGGSGTGGSATLDTDTAFQGQILALTSISLLNQATINCGAAWARNGSVTMDENTINICAGIGLPDSGEGGTGGALAGFQAMDSFLDLLNDRGVAPLPGEEMAPPGTVSALGYWPASNPAANSPFAAFDETPAGGIVGERTFWASLFGGYSFTEGDALAGTNDLMSRNFGVAAGIDFQVTADATVGFALAAGGTDFSLSDDLGGGSSSMLQKAVYGRTELDNGYIAGALAYALHDVSTERQVSFAGEDYLLTAEFPAHNFAAQIEGGYHLGWFTPYAALRAQAFVTPSYSESSSPGGESYAQTFDANTAWTVRKELGVRTEWTTALDDSTTLALRTRAAWAHNWSDTTVNAAFPLEPSFTVQGATPAPDSLLLSAGAAIGFNDGLAIAASFDSALAQNAQTYSGNVKVSSTF